jgi:hypothetical protein
LWDGGQLAAAVHDTGVHIRPVSGFGGEPLTGTPCSPRHWLPSWLPRRNRELVTSKVKLNQKARAFLYASIRRDRWRRRRTTTILSGLLALAIAAAVYAFFQQRAAQLQQRIATAHGLVAQADEARGRDPRIALLLGIAAHHIHPDGETQASLVSTLITTHYAGNLTGYSYPVISLALGPNGRALATVSEDDTVALWDLSDPAKPRRLGQPLTGHSDRVTSLALAPDGRTLATGSGDQTVILWDLSDPAKPRRLGEQLTGYSNSVTALAFVPSGRILSGADWDGTVISWNLAGLY